MRRRTVPAALLAAIALVAAILPAAAPAEVAAIGGPLPPCRIGDVLTIPNGAESWSTTLVDWTLDVGKYKPPDLVSVSQAGVGGGGLIRKITIDDLRALANAARANGTPIASFSAYRSYATQTSLFNSYAKGYGYAAAITFSARPGHSEHQLGLAIDFSPAGFNGFISGTSAVGRWMAKNSWKYGWILSYPNSKSDVVCYRYEPWHFRYYGRELAAAIHDSGLTSREYLWSHFTAVDPTTGLPIATPTAVPSATPSSASTDTASVAPSGAPGSLPAGSPAPGDSATATPPTASVDQTGGAGAPALIIGIAVLLGIVALTVWRGGVRRRGGSGGAATTR